ncbi:glycoside hydrolase family 97 protein [Carboxylicivirga sp. N1Y90]|uniref:glycoside hydrolase family 97 protein n=1 Tax=Carboxylicivirga fragile TaxID=3417571 RepID=UPI003D34C93D|nr:glycoside hydrolase family 97 protein [Marinilabiliaceae bacterium N1Y90]
MTNLIKITTLLCATFLFVNASAKEKVYSVSSPDKTTVLSVHVSNKVQISIQQDGKFIVSPSELALELESKTLAQNPKVLKVDKRRIEETIKPVVKVKEAEVLNNCNELSITFDGNYAMSFRAYNEGVAYRFETSMVNDITVVNEKGEYSFPENYMCWWGREKKFQSHNQVYYDYTSVQKLGKDDLASLPLILNPANGPKIVIAETDLIDYPGWWLRGAEGLTLSGTSAQVVKHFDELSDRNLPIKKRESYIAKTKGTRTFPWRIFAIARNDAELVVNQLTFLLASENKIENTDWIQPGKVAWDWWNANNVYGVDFRAGFNTETYKHYIDFASEYGIENIMLDEGWYELGDITAVKPELNLKELIEYADSKNVGVLLWVVWKTLDNQIDEGFELFKDLGIKGIKVDFMNRDDQWMVNYFHRIAAKAAEYELMVDFHGSYKPAGLRRMYPNVMTREGVNGGEQFKWSLRQTPEHDLILPFGRMLAGPLDYTPGAMANAQDKDFEPIFDTPMSMGTRCHQLAMFVIYESPIQMLCDSPTRYKREPECMKFLSDVPTVWDRTVVLDAKVSDYLLMARQNGDKWYIGGMGDWDERDLELDLSFLPEGKKYTMTIYTDGINADRDANDFKVEEIEVDNKYKSKIKLFAGGGVAAMLHPLK